MYRATFRIEYFDEIMAELIHDYVAKEILSDAFTIFLNMFSLDGRLLPEFSDIDELGNYCRESYSMMEDIPIDDLDDNFPNVIESLIAAFFDNICGFFGQAPTHPLNVDNFLALLAFYHEYGSVNVLYHEYSSYTGILTVCVN